MIGFMLLLRGGELQPHELRDITVSSAGGVEYVTIFIRKSKTDQEEMGVFRSLDITHQDWRPAAQMQNWLGEMEGHPKETNGCGADILGLVTRLIKWSAAGRRLSTHRFDIHSLRAVGPTCLYHDGVDFEYIRGFGGRGPALARFLYISAIRCFGIPPTF